MLHSLRVGTVIGTVLLLLVVSVQLAQAQFANEALDPNSMGSINSVPIPSPSAVPNSIAPFQIKVHKSAAEAFKAYAEWHTRTIKDPGACKAAKVLVWQATAVSATT